MFIPAPYYLLAIVLCLALAGLGAWVLDRRVRRRARLLACILDLADDLERSLRECRSRLQGIPPMVARSLLPASDLTTVRATRAAEPQIQAALRDLLGHRLWIKAHASDATFGELVAAHASLLHSRSELDQQIDRLVAATAELDGACDARRVHAVRTRK